MMRVGDFITRQSKAILENKQHAILYAVLFSVLPLASWLSVAVVLLVTLRKGAKSGFEIMIPAIVIHSVPLMMLVPLESALLNTLVAYMPCYFAALALRKTASWRAVFGVFLMQAFIVFLIIQLLFPDLVFGQFVQMKQLFGKHEEYRQLFDIGAGKIGTFFLAQLLLGFQILGVIASSIISLMYARSIQAKLFLPGGFRQEVNDFRGGKCSFLLLLSVVIGSYYELPIAINILPLILCYFLMSGISLAYFILSRKRQVRVVILLFLLILIKPTFVLFTYIVFGSLDSLFNFRLYLPKRVRESI